MKSVEYSVVAPVMNEEENVILLYEAITNVLKDMTDAYEIIMVDDGSTDRTYSILSSIHAKDKHLKVVKFRRNFGQSAAMAAGFEQATGEIVISMDGDLQNDPKDIPAMVDRLKQGYDIVAGWRKNRQDKVIIRKVPSKIANKIIRYFTGVELHYTGCSLKAYRGDLIRRIALYGELHRFIPALARIEGARLSEMVVSHHARRFGVSKYSITRTFRVIMDLATLNLFIKYLNNPLHLFGKLGIAFNAIGSLALGWAAYLFNIKNYDLSEVNVLTSFAFLMIAAGFQFVFFGLLASMVVKTGEKKNGKIREYSYY